MRPPSTSVETAGRYFRLRGMSERPWMRRAALPTERWRFWRGALPILAGNLITAAQLTRRGLPHR